jgi:hypothetical protein
LNGIVRDCGGNVSRKESNKSRATALSRFCSVLYLKRFNEEGRERETDRERNVFMKMKDFV